MTWRLCFWVIGIGTLIGTFVSGAAAEDCDTYLRRSDISKIDTLNCAAVRQLVHDAPREGTCEGIKIRRVSRVILELRERELLICPNAKTSHEVATSDSVTNTRGTSTIPAPRIQQKGQTGATPTKKPNNTANTPVALVSAPKVPINVSKLISDAQSFAKKASVEYDEVHDKCLNATPCPPELQAEERELDQQRIMAMGIYLRVVARWGTDEQLHEASGFVGLANAGTSPDQILGVLKKARNRGTDIDAAISLLDLASSALSAKTRELLVRRIRATDQKQLFEDVLLELDRPNVDEEHFEKVLRKLRPDEMKKLHGVVGNVEQLVNTQRALQNRPMILIMTPPLRRDAVCNSSTNMALAIEQTVTAISAVRNPLYVERERFDESVKWAKCKCKYSEDVARKEDCGTAPEAGLANLTTLPVSCQAVLSVTTSDLNGKGTAEATLDVLVPADVRLRGGSLSHKVSVEFPTGCDDSVIRKQEMAANKLVTSVADRFDYLAGLPRFQEPSQTVVVPAQLSDVTITGARHLSEDLTLLRDKGIELVGNCGREEFRQGLQSVLKENETIFGGLKTNDPGSLLLEVGAVGTTSCKLTLKHRGGPQIVSVQGTVSEHPWQAAGGGAGESLLKYYEPLQPRSKFKWKAVRSLALSGMPQLTDSNANNDTLGWALAGTDIALLTSGLGFLWGSISERNAYGNTGEANQLDRANMFQYVGWALLGTSLAERLVTGAFYGFGQLDPRGH